MHGRMQWNRRNRQTIIRETKEILQSGEVTREREARWCPRNLKECRRISRESWEQFLGGSISEGLCVCCWVSRLISTLIEVGASCSFQFVQSLQLCSHVGDNEWTLWHSDCVILSHRQGEILNAKPINQNRYGHTIDLISLWSNDNSISSFPGSIHFFHFFHFLLR